MLRAGRALTEGGRWQCGPGSALPDGMREGPRAWAPRPLCSLLPECLGSVTGSDHSRRSRSLDKSLVNWKGTFPTVPKVAEATVYPRWKGGEGYCVKGPI